MKQLILLIIFSVTSAFSTVLAFSPAEQSEKANGNIMERLERIEGITIVQPVELRERLIQPVQSAATAKSQANAQADQRSKSGTFRIEVFADNSRNAKSQATAKLRNVQSRFPQYPATINFESPFWRVRVGEFRSKGDADSALQEIRQAFPSYTPYLRVIRDR